MRRPALTWLLLVASVCTVFTRDLTTTSGLTYYEISVRRIESTGIGVFHRDGTAFLDFSILPPEIRKEFGYTEEAYAAAKSAETIQKQQQALALERQRRLAEKAQELRALEQLRIAESKNAGTPIALRDYKSRDYTSRGYTVSRSAPSTPPAAESASSRTQCAATTKKGYRCTRTASSGSQFCWQHGK